MLTTFALDNTQLGVCFSAYGIVAVAAYLLGGPVADRFPPRKLMAAGLISTALGGLLLATYPDYLTLRILYGYWGFTTIFLFWAPMIKATRIWGGAGNQGKAFGFLDGGRGLVGALFGALGVAIFAAAFGDLGEAAGAMSGTEGAGPALTPLASDRQAFRVVLLACSGLVGLVGLLVFFLLRTAVDDAEAVVRKRISIARIREVLALPAVRLLMVIILCAYVGYKVTDVISLYAKDVLGYDQVASARVGTWLLFLRPVAGVTVGVLADRTLPSSWLTGSFVVAGLGGLLFAGGLVTLPALFLLSTLTIGVGVYAARALYFAVMEAGQIPLALTGTAVGLISIVGYTPDIFAGPLMGYFLDGYPGITGHQWVFGLVSVFSLVGGVAAWRYHRRTRG